MRKSIDYAFSFEYRVSVLTQNNMKLSKLEREVLFFLETSKTPVTGKFRSYQDIGEIELKKNTKIFKNAIYQLRKKGFQVSAKRTRLENGVLIKPFRQCYYYKVAPDLELLNKAVTVPDKIVSRIQRLRNLFISFCIFIFVTSIYIFLK